MGWQLIQSYNVGDGITTAPAASVTFSSIPQNYKSLKIAVSGRNTDATSNAPGMRVALNGSTANFTVKVLYGSGTAVGSYSDTNEIAWTGGDQVTTNVFASSEIHFSNYSSTSVAKSISSESVIENNATVGYPVMSGMIWSNTSAITSIILSPNNQSWKFGTTFTLYGLI